MDWKREDIDWKREDMNWKWLDTGLEAGRHWIGNGKIWIASMQISIGNRKIWIVSQIDGTSESGVGGVYRNLRLYKLQALSLSTVLLIAFIIVKMPCVIYINSH